MRAVLSRDLLATIRHDLSVQLPGVGTSRLSECLAAAFGFDTNAALLAHVDATAPDAVCSVDGELESFHQRMVRFGLPGAPHRLEAETALLHALDTARARIGNGIGSSLRKGRIHSDIGLKADDDRSTVVERIVRAHFLFAWRSNVASIGNYVADFSEEGGGSWAERLLALWIARRDIDRPIADFLVDWLSDAIERDDAVGTGTKWGHPIFIGYRPRIERFFSSIAMTTFFEDALPQPIAAVPSPRRQQRSVRIVAGTALAHDEVGLRSTGNAHTVSSIQAVVAMAAYRAGMSKQSIASLATEMYAAIVERGPVAHAFQAKLRRLFASSDDMLWGEFSAFLEHDARSLVQRSDIVLANDDGAIATSRSVIDEAAVRRAVPTPPATVPEDRISDFSFGLAEFNTALISLMRREVDAIEIDFQGVEPHPGAIDQLCHTASLSGAQILAIRAPASTAALLQHALSSILGRHANVQRM